MVTKKGFLVAFTFICVTLFSFRLSAQLVDIQVSNFIITSSVGMPPNYVPAGEKYSFAQDDIVIPWIRVGAVTTGVAYQIIIEWYNPSGSLVFTDRSDPINTAPYVYHVPNTFSGLTCISGLWKVIYKIKHINSGIIYDIGHKNFTLTCSCIPPPAPIVTNAQICRGNTANLMASGCSGGIITWWDMPTLGSKVWTGTTYPTFQLSNNTIYYAQCEVNSCISETRSAATVTVQQCNAGNSCPSSAVIQLEKQFTANGSNYDVAFTLTGAPPQYLNGDLAYIFNGYKVEAGIPNSNPMLPSITPMTIDSCKTATSDPRLCPLIIIPDYVCGCNGATYSSPCYATADGNPSIHSGAYTGSEKIQFSTKNVAPNTTFTVWVTLKYRNGNPFNQPCTYIFQITTPNCTLRANAILPITKCGTGAQIFNLTTYNSSILGSQNGTVNWYTDANATQLIPPTTANNYSSIGTTVYARIISPQGCQSNIIPVVLQVTTQSPSAGTPASALVLCSGSNNSTVQLSSLITGASSVGEWQFVASSGVSVGSNFSAANGTLNPTGLAVNTYQFKHIVSNECDRDTAVVTVRIAPKPTANPIDTIKNCGTGTFDLTQSSITTPILGTQTGSRVNWFSDANGSTAITTASNYDISRGSTVYAQVINSDNCTSNLIAVKLKQIATPYTGIPLQPMSLCYRTSGLSLIYLDNLIINEQAGGVWSLEAGSQEPAAAFNSVNGTLNPNGLSAGKYRFKYLIANTCGQEASTTIEVNIGNQPTANAGRNDTINCKKMSVVLTGTPNVLNTAFEWKSPTGSTYSGISTTVQEGGIYTFTATDNASGCKASSTVTVLIDKTPPVITDITTKAATCANTTDGEITVNTTGSSLMYKLDNGVFGTSKVFKLLKGGNYTVTVQSKNFCEASKSVTITAPPPFTQKISFPPCYYYVGSEVQLILESKGGITPIKYVWSVVPSVNLSYLTLLTPKFTIKDTNSLKIRVIAADITGCIATDSILFDKIRENKAPDIITPNGDGANDVLAFPDLECGKNPTQFIDNEITIVNRWGTVVYYMKNYDNTWGGTNQDGQLLPQGTYFYVLRLSIGQGRIYRGNVLIMRQ